MECGRAQFNFELFSEDTHKENISMCHYLYYRPYKLTSTNYYLHGLN